MALSAASTEFHCNNFICKWWKAYQNPDRRYLVMEQTLVIPQIFAANQDFTIVPELWC